MSIHPTSVIEDGAQIGDGVKVGPFCHVSAAARLESGVDLKSHVVIAGRTSVGANCIIYPYAFLGGPPQHLGYDGEDTALDIGANNIIRENTTMNLGTKAGGGVTRIGNNGYFMTGAHIGHDCQVGDHAIFANNATLGGHAKIGDHVFLGGLTAVHQFNRVGSYAFVGGCSAVTSDVIPYARAVGNRAKLIGLNAIGMKRRGAARETIHGLREAYRMLFEGEGIFKERIERVALQYANNIEVMEIVDFINGNGARALMRPEQ